MCVYFITLQLSQSSHSEHELSTHLTHEDFNKFGDGWIHFRTKSTHRFTVGCCECRWIVVLYHIQLWLITRSERIQGCWYLWILITTFGTHSNYFDARTRNSIIRLVWRVNSGAVDGASRRRKVFHADASVADSLTIVMINNGCALIVSLMMQHFFSLFGSATLQLLKITENFADESRH